MSGGMLRLDIAPVLHLSLFPPMLHDYSRSLLQVEKSIIFREGRRGGKAYMPNPVLGTFQLEKQRDPRSLKPSFAGS